MLPVLGVRIGTACARIQDEKMRGLNRAQIEVDEIGGFIGAKRNNAAGRYNPAEVVKTEKAIICGMPDMSRISTSHLGKQNHTLRMHCRRLTRLMKAFSKKFENFEAAVALNFCYYDFVKTHGAIRMTPAQAAGVENGAWTITELVERCGE